MGGEVAGLHIVELQTNYPGFPTAMFEKEMQELLWQYPERFLNEPLKQVGWESSSPVGRSDLVFEDRHGRLLIIEVKRGKLPRGAIDQLLDYFGMMKQKYPGKPVELMVVANEIPSERKIACESRDIECRPISEKTFRDVAAEVGYKFASEEKPPAMTAAFTSASEAPRTEKPSSWKFGGGLRRHPTRRNSCHGVTMKVKNSLSCFSRPRKARPLGLESRGITRVDSRSSFIFRGLALLQIVWGFPASSRNGRSIRQRLAFPFDFSIKAGVKEEFINELGAALSAVVPLSGGGKRPTISVSGLDPQQRQEVVETIFRFAVKASNATMSN